MVKQFLYRCLSPAIVLLAVFFLSGTAPLLGGERKSERKIYAHYYGAFPFARRAMALYVRHNYHSMSPGDENKDGNPLRAMPLHNRWLVAHWELSPSESADIAIRRALRAGLDGFAVNAWCGGGEGRRMLHVLMRVAKNKDYPFELTAALDPYEVYDIFTNPSANPSNPPGRTVEKILHAAEYVVTKFGNHPKLARRNGKPLLFIHNGRLLAHCYRESHDNASSTISALKLACEAIRECVGQPVYLVVDVAGIYPRQSKGVLSPKVTTRLAREAAKKMKAVTVFQPNDEPDWVSLGKSVEKNGAEWCFPLCYQYENLDYRIRAHAFSVGGERFRQQWRKIRESDTSLVFLHSWNDYRVLSHISPTFSHNYVPLDLTGYFARWWKEGDPPETKDDRIYCLYRRYPPGTRITPFNKYYPEPEHGALEVLTILKESGRVVLKDRGENGEDLAWDAPAGLSFRQFPLKPGPVEVELLRNGKKEKSLSCPEWITDRPFRQDNALVAYSTEYMKHWQADWETPPLDRKNQKPIFYSEYGDADSDGLPNWFEMYYFGKWNDAKSKKRADPEADPDKDGKTNREEYLARTDPKKKGKGIHDPSKMGKDLDANPPDDRGMLDNLMEE
ncbi:MAG: hypothetical protein KGZ25_09120 [Planctomycetes bacterium]|nr:hypothetical protein [Planctomycetota bacterium]